MVIEIIEEKISVLNSYNTESIFLQYPTQGYGWSLLPQIICIYYSIFTNKKFVVILHEFSQRSLKAKLATLFLFFANEIIFTTDFERNYSKSYSPLLVNDFIL